jgi:hypothetical protein
VSPPAELAHAVATLDAHRFERLYRGYACCAEIHR